MAGKFWQEEIECMPLKELAQLQERKLRESRVIQRAYFSSLYNERWRKADVSPEKIRNREDLKRIPFTTGMDLKNAFTEERQDKVTGSSNVRLWLCTSGTTGVPKWIPYSDNDISEFGQIMLRDFYVYDAPENLKFFILTTPAPFISGGAAYFNLFTQMLNDIHVEHILASFTNTREGLELALRRKSEAFFAFPSIAMRIAEKLADEAGSEAKQRFAEKRGVGSFAAMLLTKVKRVEPKHIIKFKYGLFSGEPLEPYRKAIIEAYGLEPFELYAFTEFPCFNIECFQHNGIHLWMDTCIAELIPQQELDKEDANPGYVPQTLFLDEAEPGATGEYVVTTFGEAFPLIRYRTSDLIQIVGMEKCGCGRTHPRIKVLQRIDDVVNMGIVRFSTFELDACLASISNNGKVNEWQLRIVYEGYKPKPVLWVEAINVGKNEAFVDEVKTKLLGIKALQLGCEAGIVAQPDIRVLERINEHRTPTGKLKRVIYDYGHNVTRPGASTFI